MSKPKENNSTIKNEERQNKKVNIIITCSLQKDFLQKRGIKDLIHDKPGESLKIDYESCEEQWVEHFKEYNPSNSEIEAFLSKIKKSFTPNESSKKIEVSYHKFIERYYHRVHVDYDEHKRIWDENELEEFINNLTKSEYGSINDSNNSDSTESKPSFYYIHLRDWHDLIDVDQLDEFIAFGSHCIKGTPGAEFIEPLQEFIKKNKINTFIINSNSLSSFTDTNLNSVLNSIIKNENCKLKNVKIGMFGVITNVKLSLLTFELKVVHKYRNIFVCKDFSAGFNRKGHEEGINFIEKALHTPVLNKEQFTEVFQI